MSNSSVTHMNACNVANYKRLNNNFGNAHAHTHTDAQTFACVLVYQSMKHMAVATFKALSTLTSATSK